MPSEPVHIRIERDLPHERGAAYEWLTDFEDDDSKRTGAVVTSRRVTVREPRRLVYEGRTKVLGRESWAVTEVELSPPSAWTARVTDGPRLGSHTTYSLEPRPEGGCRLVVDYTFVFVEARTGRMMRLLKPLVRRALGRMWDGFAASMAKELAEVRPSRAVEA